jgi:hypothetical protein
MNSAVVRMTSWLWSVKPLDVFDRIARAVNSAHRAKKSSPRLRHRSGKLVAIRRATVPVGWAARSIRWASKPAQ